MVSKQVHDRGAFPTVPSSTEKKSERPRSFLGSSKSHHHALSERHL